MRLRYIYFATNTYKKQTGSIPKSTQLNAGNQRATRRRHIPTTRDSPRSRQEGEHTGTYTHTHTGGIYTDTTCVQHGQNYRAERGQSSPHFMALHTLQGGNEQLNEGGGAGRGSWEENRGCWQLWKRKQRRLPSARKSKDGLATSGNIVIINRNRTTQPQQSVHISLGPRVNTHRRTFIRYTFTQWLYIWII